MTARSWIDDEVRLTAAIGQAARLLLAGLKRPVALLGAFALLGGLLAGTLILRKHSYTPRFVFRVVEAQRNAAGTPRPRRQLAEYVQQGVFTSAPLLEMMNRHGLYPSLARKNPRAALDSFREDIEVSVYQNYFLEERPLGAAPRSARLAISYRNPDPDVATSVTRELGELVVAHETSVRRDQAASAAERAKDEVDAARGALARRRSEIAQKEDELQSLGGTDPQRQVEFVGLLGSLPALELRQDQEERREATLSLGAALERHGIGMSFEMVEDASLPATYGVREGQILLALASLALGLPLVTLAIGAFGTKRGFT